MAGPGGGGSSGGGFGGGSFGGGGGFSGGGFGGGSFGGGPHHHPPHHHHHGPIFWSPFRRRYYGGGGCFPGIVIALFVLFGFLWIIGEPTDYDIVVNSEPLYSYEVGIVYDEATMQNYANERYKEVFGDYDGYEDNILLVFLTNDEADGYYTIAWVGDNIRSEINEMFGEYTAYGQYLDEYINDTYYAYSLDTDLAEVVAAMESSITAMKFDSSFRTAPSSAEGKKSGIIDYTDLDLTEELVNDFLVSFTENTGIPMVIVVDRAETVFGFDEDEAVTVVPSMTANVVDSDSEEADTSVSSEVIVPDSEAVTEDDGWVTTEVVRIDYTKIILAVIATASTVALIVSWLRPAMKKKKASEKEHKNDMPWES